MASAPLNFDIYAKDHASATFDKFGKSVGKSTSGVSSLRQGLGLLVTAFAGLAIISKVTQFMEDSVAQARESVKVQALTTAAIKSTGGAANITADEIANLANAQSLKIGVDDETIQSGENLLLTFTNIRNEVGKGNDIFDQATITAENMSAALGQDMKSSVMQLGKALNDPIKGLTALQRVGVSFTDQQKEQITTLTETGHRMKAQKIILHELKREFGGAAKSMADPADRAKVAWENFKEYIGLKLLPLLDRLLIWFTNTALPAIKDFGQKLKEKLGPAFETLGDGIRKVRGPLGDVVRFVVKNGDAFAAFAITVAALAASTKAWAEAQILLNAATATSPWKRSIIALGLLAGAIFYARQHSQKFADAMDRFTHGIASDFGHLAAGAKAVAGAFKTAWGAVDRANNWLHNALASTWRSITQTVTQAWSAIKSRVSSAMSGIKSAISSSSGAIRSAVSRAFSGLPGLVSSAMGKMASAVAHGVSKMLGLILRLPGQFVSALGSLASTLYRLGLAAMQGFLHGIQAGVGAVIDAAQNAASSVADAVSGALQIFSPSKVMRHLGEMTMKGLADGIKHGAQTVQQTMLDATNNMLDNVNKAIDKLKSAIDNVNSHLDALLSKRRDFQSSFVDAFSSNLFTSTDKEGESFDTIAELKQHMANQRAMARKLRRDTKILLKKGLSKDLIQQLAASGPEGMNTIDMLAGASAQTVHQFNVLNAQTNQALGQTANWAGADLYQDSIKKVEHHLEQMVHRLHELKDKRHDLAQQAHDLAHAIAQALDGAQVDIGLGPKEVQRGLLQLKRHNGGGGLGFD